MARKVNNFGEIINFIERDIQEVDASAKRFAKQMAEDGAQITKDLTATRPWPKDRTDKEGRIDTRKMINSITHGTIESSPGYIKTFFGWENPDEYFLLQTETGINYANGNYVGPTLALQDATLEVETAIDEWIQREGRA